MKDPDHEDVHVSNHDSDRERLLEQKAMLARIAQPFFRRPGGGSKIPIRISGPRSNPAFGLDVRRIFNRG